MPARNVTIKANFFSPFGDWTDESANPKTRFTLIEGSGSDPDTFLMETEVVPGVWISAYEGTLVVDTEENEIDFTATHSYLKEAFRVRRCRDGYGFSFRNLGSLARGRGTVIITLHSDGVCDWFLSPPSGVFTRRHCKPDYHCQNDNPNAL